MGKFSAKELIFFSWAVSLICSLVVVIFFFNPIFLPISIYLKNYEGLWMAFQGVGIPASLFLAIYMPTLQERKNNLNRLVAHRNIAFFVERYVRAQIAPSFNAGLSQLDHKIGYLACLDELEKLDRSQIYPAQYIETFVDFINHSKQVAEFVGMESLEKLAVEKVKSIDKRLSEDIREIDDYLRREKVKFNDKNIAYI